MKAFFQLILTVGGIFALAGNASAAASKWQDIAGGRIRVVAGEPLPGAKTVHAMLQVDLQPGWKTYWRDPGDAGVPLQINLGNSANVVLGKVVFPAPHRFNDGVSVWAGYKEPVAFGIEIDRVDDAKPVRLAGDAFLGVCEKICVPVQYEFSLEIEDSATPTMHGELVAMAMKSMPMAASPAFMVESIVVDSNKVHVTAKVPNGVDGGELFLAPSQGVQIAAPALASSEGGKLQFEAVLLGEGAKATAGVVAYTLVTNAGAISGEIALERN